MANGRTVIVVVVAFFEVLVRVLRGVNIAATHTNVLESSLAYGTELPRTALQVPLLASLRTRARFRRLRQEATNAGEREGAAEQLSGCSGGHLCVCFGGGAWLLAAAAVYLLESSSRCDFVSAAPTQSRHQRRL